MFVYIISLENNKYYVFFSIDPHIRIDTFKVPYQLNWLLINKPIRIIEKLPYSNGFSINDYVFDYMKNYGINSTRGGDFSQVVLSKHQEYEISLYIDTNTNYKEVDSDEEIIEYKPKKWICFDFIRKWFVKKRHNSESLLEFE